MRMRLVTDAARIFILWIGAIQILAYCFTNLTASNVALYDTWKRCVCGDFYTGASLDGCFKFRDPFSGSLECRHVEAASVWNGFQDLAVSCARSSSESLQAYWWLVMGSQECAKSDVFSWWKERLAGFTKTRAEVEVKCLFTLSTWRQRHFIGIHSSWDD